MASIAFSDLLGKDSDVDGDALTFKLTSLSSEFGATLDYDPETGPLIYDPTAATGIQALNNGETINDNFSYSTTDAEGATS